MSYNRKIIRHVLEMSYVCPVTNKEVVVCINNPSIGTGHHFEDWEYEYVTIYKCTECNGMHNIEL